ncbi:UNVERIFIED_CONTAM: hypothetical protein GTU68_003083 [Idotea baltica]|nr:hypothetical protein [Idotea baltica]
MQGAES